MKLYTFIAECDGGTFASQHRSETQEGAVLDWLSHLPSELFEVVYGGCSKIEIESHFAQLDEEMLRIEQVNGLCGVFGGFLVVNEKEIFLFVIETKYAD